MSADDLGEFSGILYRNRLKLSADKMYRACELKDQTYKKTRTLHFSEKRKDPYFHDVRVIRLKPAIAFFWCPEARFAKKMFSSGTHETIRANQAIPANLRIDWRESMGPSEPQHAIAQAGLHGLPSTGPATSLISARGVGLLTVESQ